MKKKLLLLLVSALALSTSAFAGDFMINFEQYAGYTQITNQYTASDDVTFTNALQLVVPGYDYFDYPPHSGNGVITNDPNDQITMTFTAGIGSPTVSGWYVDPSGITVDAYDSHGNLLAAVNEAGIIGADASFSISGGAKLISYITVTDDGGSPDALVLDDISATPTVITPEPGTWLLLSTALLVAIAFSLCRGKFAFSGTGGWKGVLLVLGAAALTLAFSRSSAAQEKRALITQRIDDSKLTTLAGNTRPEATAENDRGVVSPDLPLEHMMVVLKRAPEVEAQLQQFIEDQHNPKSANFHHWIGSEEFGQRFGLAQSDVEAITDWLQRWGFQVNVVYNNKMLIDFSGTAAQAEDAFHTEIHNYDVEGVQHFANVSDPKIPSGLATAVTGIVGFNDFTGQAMHQRITPVQISPRTGKLGKPDYTVGGELPLVPYDLDKVYNIQPLFSAGISGQGMKIVVVEDTNLWNCTSSNATIPTGTVQACSSTSDWAVFRNTFGLGRYMSGNLAEENPGPTVSTSCSKPSTGAGYPSGSNINTDDDEAAIDVEWAAAAAPNATIINAACADPSGGFGGLTAIQNILNHPNADNVDVISMSYGEPETTGGATLNASFNTTFQQAVTAGIGIFVSSGDALAAGDDRNRTSATHGINISGWMSSPYDVSVGGLDFADTYFGENSTYWNSTNNVFYGSAKSYIMEQPWNDDCAGTLLAHYETGSYITYGSTGFCNTATGANFHQVAGGSGGPSGCATGTPSTTGVVSGTCAGWPKPSYQSSNIGLMSGLVNDGVRDTPDVALMAANGLWGHYYLICFSDPHNSGVACTGQPTNWPGFGGTSVSSPIMAGIQSLVVQHKGSLQGNPNNRYYALAATEYGPSGNASCDSTLGNGVGSSCIFYDVTAGDIDAGCTALSGTLHNCYKPSGTQGVLSTSNSSYLPAYPTGPDAPFGTYSRGWDFASGIGSVNAYNLVMSY